MEVWQQHSNEKNAALGKPAALEHYLNNQRTNAYATGCEEVGKAMKVPVVNIWEAMTEQKGWESMLSDGLHLNASGNEFLFKKLSRVIAGSYPHLLPAALPLDAPLWAQIDENDLEASFKGGTKLTTVTTESTSGGSSSSTPG